MKQIWIVGLVVLVLVGCGKSSNNNQAVVPPATSNDVYSQKASVQETVAAVKTLVQTPVVEPVASTEEVPAQEPPVPVASQPNVPEQEAAVKTENSGEFKPFIIYADKGTVQNHFIPSGFMPDGQCIKIEDNWKENCHAGNSCIKVTLDVPCALENQRWGGIYWQNPANNWGNRKGGFDLTGATKLTFWAKGEKGDEQIEEFKMGGITGDYPDTDTALLEKVILSKEWKQYTIDLRGKDLSFISGGFGVATNTDVNPESCTFYLDDMQYE